MLYIYCRAVEQGSMLGHAACVLFAQAQFLCSLVSSVWVYTHTDLHVHMSVLQEKVVMCRHVGASV